jgi:small subunit ribosomal protein S9
MTVHAKQSVVVNGKPLEEYFVSPELVRNAISPLGKHDTKFSITALVSGGGIAGQADALKHGLARGILAFDESSRVTLKRLGFLKRDPRAKERRKPGLKKARKAGQWSKR